MKIRRKTGFIILAVLFSIIVVEGYLYYKTIKYQKEPVPEAIAISDVLKTNSFADFESESFEITSDTDPTEIVQKKSMAMVEIPAELNLKMSFYSQAPYANWDYPWQEACEEASVLLVANEYFQHNWTKAEFNQQILDIVEWEKTRFGSYEHTDVAQTAVMLDEYLELDSIVHENPSFEDVKRILARGHLIVMTFAGKELGNPNYTNGGPMYHAMVIKGYKEGDKVIVHDVGTRRGEDYVYTWAVIEGAMRDWAEPISEGEKRMIEVLPAGSSDGASDNF